MSDVVILNRAKSHRKGIVIERNGRITLRSRPCRLLGLETGSRISFVVLGQQMYLLKEPEPPVNKDTLRLCGRKFQLHCCSKDTALEVLKNAYGAGRLDKVELNVSPSVVSVSIGMDKFDALAVINIVDNH